MADFLLPDDDHERRMLLRLDSALEDWLSACADAGLHAALPLAVAREGWLAGVDEAAPSQQFLAGAVNICTLMPMRAPSTRASSIVRCRSARSPASPARWIRC